MYSMELVSKNEKSSQQHEPATITKQQQVFSWSRPNNSIGIGDEQIYVKKQFLTSSAPNSSSIGIPCVRRESLRVLIYTACYNVIDGVTVTIRKLESAILETGGSVCILTTRSGNDNNTNLVPEHPRRRVIFIDDAVLLPFTESGKDSDQAYYLGKSLSKNDLSLLAEFEPSVIHITVPDCVGLQVIGYARDNEIPLMGTYHSNIIDYMDHYGVGFVKCMLNAFFVHSYGFLQTLYVPTPYMKHYLSTNENKYYNIDNYTDLKVWGRGIDLNTFNPRHRSEEFRTSLSIKPEEVVILFVGRLVHEKRPDIFANVIRRLNKKNISFKALVVGAGPYESEMKKLPNTICVGWLSNMDELATAYASSDIFLFPGALETFGNVTMEAAASGLPIVAEAGCSGHLIENGMSGFACKDGDEDAFFDATHHLAVDHKLRERFSLASRSLTLKYDKSVVMAEMISNYHHTITEFNITYKGSHFNRDIGRKLRLPKSFPMGRIPYPSRLRIVTTSFLFILPLAFPILAMIHNCISAIQYVRLFFVDDQMYDENQDFTDVENKGDGKSLSSAPAAENQFLSTLFSFLTMVFMKSICNQSNKQYEPLLIAFRRKKTKSCL